MATVLHNERSVYDALCNRYKAPEWAIFSGVANGTGARAKRTADALAMSLWPSRGLELMGFEIKVSRGDLLRELKDPAKAEAVAKYCDRWWIAAGSKEIVKPEELPRAWGLLIPHGKTMKIVKDAGALPSQPVTREFLAAILRRAHEVVEGSRDKLRHEMRGSIREEVEKGFGDKIKRLEERAAASDKRSADLLSQLRCAADTNHHPSTIGKALDLLQRIVGWHGARQSMDNIERSMRRDAERLVDLADTLKEAQTLCAPLEEDRS